MIVLAVNCGSSSLKFRLFDFSEEDGDAPRGSDLARGVIDRIGSGRSRLDFRCDEGTEQETEQEITDHREAFGRAVAWLHRVLTDSMDRLGAVGHRIVHGADVFTRAVRIDDPVMKRIEELVPLAPLHNGVALQGIEAARACLGNSVPMAAVFDTSFHANMPQRASAYAVPNDWESRYQVKRYGFHGIAVSHMVERFAGIAGGLTDESRLILLQLGNGCSATAVKGGVSIDTSMGLTPLEGLMMGTRSGDVDPSLAGFVARCSGVETDEVERSLNAESGLLGVSGRSADMRDLLAAAQSGDPRAELAIDMFCYRVRKYIGAYLGALGGAQAVLFGGGIGQNAPAIRARICEDMAWCGLKIDPRANDATVGKEGRISPDGAAIQVYVIPVDEELVIAREAFRCLQGGRS